MWLAHAHDSHTMHLLLLCALVSSILTRNKHHQLLRATTPVELHLSHSLSFSLVCSYDYSYDSFDPSASNYADQQAVWDDIGVGILDNAYKGTGTC